MRLTLFLRSLSGAGAERCMANLATALAARGARVDMALGRAKGPFLSELPPAVRVIDLNARTALQAIGSLIARPADLAALSPVLVKCKAPRVLGSIPALARYLRRERPTAMISALNFGNIAAICATATSGVGTPLVISQHNHFTSEVLHAEKARMRRLPPLLRHFYPRAGGIIAVSDGVADDLSKVTGIARERIETVYNPVVTTNLLEGPMERPEHDWFRPGEPPVILSVASLNPRKGLTSLLLAFERVRRVRPVRLIILGEGPERGRLTALAQKLGIAADVDLKGFVTRPYPYMAHASVFVLSSIYEGLPTVIIEAMACGCPVVSTDCPSGPAEILEHGKYGPLVPVGDHEAIAGAILATLDRPPDRDRLRERARLFTADRAADRLIAVVEATIRSKGMRRPEAA